MTASLSVALAWLLPVWVRSTRSSRKEKPGQHISLHIAAGRSKDQIAFFGHLRTFVLPLIDKI